MKKSFTLLSVAAMCSFSAMAQFGNNPVVSLKDEGSLKFIPMEYTADGVAKLYSKAYNDDGRKQSFSVYDSNFDQVVQIGVNSEISQLQAKRYTKLLSVEVKVRYAYPNLIENGGDGQPVVGLAYSNSHSYGYGISQTEALEQMKSMFGPEITTEQKGDSVYFYIAGAYYQQDNYGTKYPERYGVWTPESSNEPSQLNVYENQYTEVASFSKSAATAFCRNDGYELKEVEGKICFFPADEYRYFMRDRFGKTYPQECFYLSDEGALTRYNLEYGASAQFADDWILERSWYEESNAMSVEGIEPMMAKLGNVDMDDFEISQTLFNNDADYEYVVPVTEVYESDDMGSDYIDGVGSYEVKTVYQHERIIGYKVCGQGGNEIAKLMLPAGYIGDYLGVVDFGDKRYLTVETYKNNDGERNYYTLVYKINPDASGVMQMVGDPIEVTVAPRVTRRSAPITVSFGDSKSERQVVVTSVNGMTAMTLKVAAGETSAKIDTSRLSQGMYIVTVVEGSKKIENCKVIIR